jgi:acyl dehydratase
MTVTQTTDVAESGDALLAGPVFEDVAVGDRLPELAIDVSRRTIIATAIASRDYQDVHHDHEAAQRRGSEDIFMNILSTNGYVLRLVTDWAGPEAVVEHAAIRLGVPNYAGDTLRLAGTVAAVEDRDGEGAVEVEVVGRNSLGDHVTGTVRVTLPKGSTA